MKVEVAVLGSPSLRVSMVSVDVKQHLKKKMKTKIRRSATAVARVSCGVHKLLGTGEVSTSLTLLFWRWLTACSVFTGRSGGTSYS